MKWSLEIVMEASFVGVRRAAAIVRAALAGGANLHEIDAVELALVEACTNAVRHGSGAGHPVRVTIGLDDGSVRVTVENHGRPFAIDGVAPPEFDPRDPSTLPTGGMGLSIIRELMDSASCVSANGINRIHMVRRLEAFVEEVPP
jgi:serine/threonine-protein kinase RsbW